MGNKLNFFDKLKDAVIERQVEDVYNEGINLYFPTSKIEYPFACDGFIDTKTENGKILKLIIEYKLDEMLNNKVARAKVLIQVVFYLKKFEQSGLVLPNVCMVGDKNECFVIHTNSLLKYLDEENVDWSIAPSTSSNVYTDFVVKIANDEEINPFVFSIDTNFDFKDVADKIKDLADNVQRYVHVTEHNISTIYDYFCRNVIKSIKKIKSHDLVGIFMGVITNSEEYYQHPAKKNILVTPLGNIDINGDGFKSFFGYFQRNYTPQEKNNLTAIADRLIEDTDRRNSGDFWTPTLFVDYAHKMISEQLGDNWKDEYVVWDNCCGGKNLTRDYKFKELYCSTLFDSELKIADRYNKEATTFQFDFLNDYIPMPDELVQGETKIPQRLLDAFKENKKIVFFLNPPYGTAANNMGADGSDKKNIGKTRVNTEMLTDKIGGGASQNLYTQFLYRILKIKQSYKLTNCHIAIFSPTLFLTGGSYTKFREKFLCDFSFNNGVQFMASHFADVADSWGISFSLWDCGEQQDKNNFQYLCIDNVDGEIKNTENKGVYNIDSLKSGSDWAKEPIKKLKTHDEPNLSSGVHVRPSDSETRGTNFDNNIGYFLNAGNNVDMNTQKVALFTSAYGNGNGHGINVDNFIRCTSLFSARKLIEKNWINSKDEYLAPNESHPKFNEFVNDSVIYSLFNTASNQSSLRQVEYKGKQWDIKNEFFWMGKDEIANLANEHQLDAVYEDAKTSNERYVYQYIKLHKEEFSAEAVAVLDKAIELTKKSFKYRQLFADEHPEYQLDKCWDCGYYQLKAIWKEFMKDDFEDFKKLYKAFGDKMRPMVYELGFLK